MSHPPRSPVQLPITLAIGFTGHRKLPDDAKSRGAIRKVLLEWIDKVPGVVYGVTSAAAGGDLLFAETCIELNLPIRVFLPLPKERFREDLDAADWNRAECVFKNALSVEVTGAGEKLSERYYECGIETVQQSRLLIALWDGEPSQGLGGTAGYGSLRQGAGSGPSSGSTARRARCGISMRHLKSSRIRNCGI